LDTMTEKQLKRCKCCNAEIPDLGDITPKGDLCDKCEGNLTRQDFFKDQKEMCREISRDELTEILGSTIKKDDSVKVNVFLDMLLTYTENDQQSTGLIAASSTGKSYVPLEEIAYFPKYDVIKLGYASPTSFFHEWGIWMRDPRLPQLPKGYEESEDEEDQKKRRQKENLTVIDLHQKILVFLDAPHSELLKHMRSLLAHDDKYIELRITDRSQKSGMRTKRILLIGYPTVVFCSANFLIDEQEKTRLNLYSPESNAEKIKAAITHKIHKDGDRLLYEKQIAEDPKRLFLQIRVDDIKRRQFKNITIPEDLQVEIDNKFNKLHPTLQARHQRDIGKLMGKIKAFAVLNYHNRTYDLHGNLQVNRDDVLDGFRQYETYRESNELGVPPEAYDAYLKLKDAFSFGLTLEEYQKKYFEIFKILLGRDKARNNLKIYTTTGLLYEEPDPNDKRRIRYMCGGVGVTNQSEKEEDDNRNQLNISVPSPTPLDIYLSKTCLGGKEIEKPQQNFPNRFCGDCGKHKLPSCGFPNGNFETLPADWYCGNMRCFIPKQSEVASFEE
jgi:hypothetical protein